jgi:hypothetical protein
MIAEISETEMEDGTRRFLVLRRKLEDALTPGGEIDDVVTIELTRWDTAFLIESLDELLLIKEVAPWSFT